MRRVGTDIHNNLEGTQAAASLEHLKRHHTTPYTEILSARTEP